MRKNKIVGKICAFALAAALAVPTVTTNITVAEDTIEAVPVTPTETESDDETVIAPVAPAETDSDSETELTYILGDVNFDDKIDLMDVSFTLRYCMIKSDCSNEQLISMDYDKDDKITLKDAQLILCSALGISINGNSGNNNGSSDSVEYTCKDVNGDKKVTLEDAQCILKAALAITSLTEEQRVNADMDFDGIISLVDAKCALQCVLGIYKSTVTEKTSYEQVTPCDYSSNMTIEGNVAKLTISFDGEVDVFDFGIMYDASVMSYDKWDVTDEFYKEFVKKAGGITSSADKSDKGYVVLGGITNECTFTGDAIELTFNIKDTTKDEYSLSLVKDSKYYLDSYLYDKASGTLIDYIASETAPDGANVQKVSAKNNGNVDGSDEPVIEDGYSAYATRVGDTVTVDVYLSGNVSIYDYAISYDAECVETQDVILFKEFNDFLNANNGISVYNVLADKECVKVMGVMPQTDDEYTGKAYTFTFKVKGDSAGEFKLVKNSMYFTVKYEEAQASGSFIDFINSDKVEIIEGTGVKDISIKNISAPEKVETENVISKEELDAYIEEAVKKALEEIIDEIFEVIAQAAPKLNSDIFATMFENDKKMSVGVTDEENNLMYEWTFDSQKQADVNEAVDLNVEISDDNEEAKEIASVAGTDEIISMSCAYKGKLPAKASFKAYVGNKFDDEKPVYLYRHEKKTKATSIKSVNEEIVLVNAQPYVVKDGYVNVSIDEGADYFLSAQIIENDAENVTDGAVNVTDGADNVTGGADNVTGGADNVTGGTSNVTGGADNVSGDSNTVTDEASDVLAGDVNCDGKVDLNDARIVLKISLGIDVKVSEQGMKNANYDANDKIDLNDAKYTLKEALGIKFTVGK